VSGNEVRSPASGVTAMMDNYGTRSLREILRVLFAHWLLMLLLVVIGGGGTYLACRLVTPIYRSSVSLMFKRPLDRSPLNATDGDKALEVFVKAQHQIVLSDLVLARAMALSEDRGLRERWLKLRSDWESARGREGGEISGVQARIDQFLQKDLEPRVRKILDTQQAELERFRKSVKLETPGGEQVAATESFTISVDRPGEPAQGDGHRLAMYAADAVADMYMVRHRELQERLSDPALRVMQAVIEAFEDEVAGDLEAYRVFVREHSADLGILEQLLKSGTEHGTQVVLTKVRENDARLTLELARDVAIHEVMKKLLPEKAFAPGGLEEMTDGEIAAAVASVSVEFLQDNVGFSESIKELTRLESRRNRIESQYTENSQEVRNLREQLTQARRNLLGAIVGHVQGLDASIKARQQQKAMHEELVRATAEEQNEIQRKLAEYAQLKNNFLVAQKHLEELRQQKVDAMANHLRARDAVTITKMDHASIPDPDRPVQPMLHLYTAVAILVSVFLGVAAAFMVDHFDHTLRSSADAERYLGLTVLGSIRKRGRRLIVEA